MKKKIVFFTITFGLLIIILTGCNNSLALKTEYKMNEIASIDEVEIIMTKAILYDKNNLEVIFKITSNSLQSRKL